MYDPEEKFRPWLIQRLEKPWRDAGINDGILKISKENLKLVDQIMSFDYMGSAEFEFGALPKAFREYIDLLEKGEIGMRTVPVEFLRPFIRNFDIENQIPESKIADVHIIAPCALIGKVVTFLEGMGIEEPRMKEWTWFRESYFADEQNALGEEYVPGDRTVGWFDIHNIFFFFRDKEMFDNIKIASGLMEDPAVDVAPQTETAELTAPTP